MLAAALRRHGRFGALDDLQQSLLDSLARDVARDGEVFSLASNLVDLVDIDDAYLGAFDVEISRRDELQQDVLHVLAHIARFGKRSGIGDGEGNLQRASKRLRKQGLARARGTEKHDVALGELHIAFIGLLAKADALVMVVHRYRKRTLGRILTHHMLAQSFVKLMRRRKRGQDLLGARHAFLGLFTLEINRLVVRLRRAVLHVATLRQHIGADRDALVANAYTVRALNHAADLVGRFAAKNAARVFRVDIGRIGIVRSHRVRLPSSLQRAR